MNTDQVRRPGESTLDRSVESCSTRGGNDPETLCGFGGLDYCGMLAQSLLLCTSQRVLRLVQGTSSSLL